jgi:hypothetical protein
MPKFKNVSPLGALDLPLLGRVVEPGEVIEVTAEQAKHLEGQIAAWQPVKGAATNDTSRAANAAQSATSAAQGTTGEDEGA